MPGHRQNRTVTLFFAILRGTRILIGLATILAIITLILWWMGHAKAG
jgi:hypothetical protein